MYRYSCALIILLLLNACAKPAQHQLNAQPKQLITHQPQSKRAKIDELFIQAELSNSAQQRFKAFYELYQLSKVQGYLNKATEAYSHTCQAANVDYGCTDSEFEQMLFKQYPHNLQTQILKLRGLLASLELKPARVLLLGLLKQNPNHTELYELALKAQISYKTLLQTIKKPNALQLFYIAQSAISQGEFQAALNLIKHQSNPGSDLIRLQALLSLGKNAQMIDELAAKLGDDVLNLHEQIANVLLNLQRPDLALHYAKANSLEQIRANLALKDYAKASVALYKRYEKSQNPLELIYSKIYGLMSGFTSSNELDKLIAKYGASADALNSYGYYLISNTQDVAKGLNLVRKALKQEPNNVYYLDSLAWGLYKLGRCKQAKDAIDRAISMGVSDDAISELLEHKREIEKCLL